MTDPHIDHPIAKNRRTGKLTGCLLLLLLTIGTGYGLLHSQSGLQWTAAAVNRLSGDTIRLTGIRGTLRDMRIDALHVSTDELELSLQNINIAWNPAALLQRRMIVDRLSAAAVYIVQRPAETTTPRQPPEHLQLPLALSVRSLTADSVYFHAPTQEDTAAAISSLVLILESDGRHHRLTQLSFDTPQGSVESRAELNGSAPFALAAHIGMKTADSWGDIAATVTGNLERFTVVAGNNPPAAKMKLEAQLHPFAENPVEQLHVVLEQWNPADLFAAAPHAKLSLSVQLAQNAAGQLQGGIRIDNHAPAPLDRGGLPAAALSTPVLITPALLTLPDIQLQLGADGTVRGTLAWNRQDRSITAALTANRLDPRQLDSRLQAARISGTIDLSGDAAEQSARADLRDGPLRLSADIVRTDGHLVLKQFNLQRNRSRLTGQGRLQLDHQQSFQWSGQLTDFNSADFIQTVDSNLNAGLQLSGRLAPTVAGTLQYTIQKSRLGKVPVSGAGEIAFTGAGQFSGTAELTAGSNRLLAQGSTDGPQQAFQLTVDAPALAQLGLGWSGDLQTKLMLRGTAELPDLDWKLTSNRLGLPGNRQLSGVTVNAHWHNQIMALNVAVAAYNTHEQATVKQLTATLDGKTTHHHLTIKAGINEDIAVRLTASGGLHLGKPFQTSRWRGQLTELSANGNMPVRLLAPAALSAGTGSLLLDDAGLSIAGGSIRIGQLHWTAGNWKTNGDFSGITLLPGIPDRSGFAPLQLGGHWHLDAAAQLTGELHVHRERGDWYLPGDIPQPLGLQQLQLQAVARSGKLTGQFALNSQTLGTATAKVTLPLRQTHAQWSIARESPLHGNVQATVSSLKWLNALLGVGMHADGELQLQADIHGTLEQPDISGTVAGTHLSLALLEQGIRLQQGTLAAHFRQADLHIDRLHFVSPHAPPPDNRLFKELALESTTGSLTVAGNIGLTGAASRLDFTVDQLPLTHKTDYWIITSGSGTTTLQQNRLSVTGNLRTDAGLLLQPPEGHPELPDDIVLINAAAPPQQRPQKLALHLDMNLHLGDKFHIRASGLEGRLTGQLQIRNDSNQQLKLNGTIAAQDTSFKAYGQNLSVKRGIVSFQGPLGDPNLNVLAVREGLVVEAGVEIMGSVRHPRVKLVSTPDVPDTEKLSWIVLGRKPDAGGLDTSVLLSAAGSILGGQSGSGFTDRITQALGVDELTFKQAGVGSSLSGQIGVVGKRISSRAYLSYERGLMASTIGITKLTYNLTPKITVVTQAGEDSAVDLFYTLQFD
ncbi:MAG: translocation/assembly module TamB domain-containing protein [Nitrosomonas sp.]|nr:MAG: translocation/assembly module TamB domain-containing protein [Nitrosomonas sp.]